MPSLLIESTDSMITSDEQWPQIIEWCSKAAEETSLATKTRQKEKYDKLISRRNGPSLDRKKVVKNVSSRTLTENEEKVLALGLNFAVAPKKIPYQEFITATESTARQLDTEKAKALRSAVSCALHKARPPANNVDKGMMKALSDLRKDEDMVILPADKGNTTVVLDKKDYTEKMNQMLEGETYKAITKDPTTRAETKVTTVLKQLEKRGYISEKERKYLSPQCSTPPLIYGLPKIHKEGLPLRQIVSPIRSPTYRLAKSLARILTPLAGKTSSFVKNSTDFAKHIRGIQLEEEDIMISFDVVSLFTKVPVAGAIDAISALLDKGNSFEDVTAIPARDICSLTELCLRSTYFQFQDRFFEQVDGVAMGSLLSPVVANLYMEAFETKALGLYSTSATKDVDQIRRRYVRSGEEELSAFHNHLNSINHSIQFTCEKESEGTLPFLDVKLKRMGEKVSTGVYRKPTHTNRYIYFSSHHHPRIKIGVVQCLKRRADTIYDEHSANREARMLQSAFEANGYPRRVIQRTLRQPPHPTTRETDTGGEQEKPILLVFY